MLTDRLEWCWLLWCFYQLFGLSFWRHPFTAEHALVSEWCNATFLQICSDEETNSSTSLMVWWWVHFWVNYSFKCIFIYRAVNELHVFVPSVRIGCVLWLLYGGVWVRLWIWNPHEPRSAPELESLPRSDCPEPPESEESLRNRWKQILTLQLQKNSFIEEKQATHTQKTVVWKLFSFRNCL